MTDERRSNADIAATDFAPGRVLCAGRPHLSDEQRARGAHLRDAAFAAGDRATIIAKLAAINNALGLQYHLDGGYYPLPAEDADLDQWHRAWSQVIHGTKRCGTDLGVLMAELPFDGFWHAVTCPSCGTVARFRPPCSAENAPAIDMAKAGALEAALALE